MKKFEKTPSIWIACLVICLLFVGRPAEAQTIADEEYENMFSEMEETESHDILSLLRQEEEFSVFVGLLERSGLAKSFGEAEEITVFAPTNEAFRDMSIRRFESIMGSEDLVELQNFVMAHIIPQRMLITDFQTDQALELAEDRHVRIKRGGGQGFGNPLVLNVGGARVGRGDIKASNGIIHVMNGVVRIEEDSADRRVQPH